MNTTTPTTSDLSPHAAARLEADLPAMRSRVARAGRVRRVARGAMAACAVAVVCAGVWGAWNIVRPGAITPRPETIARHDPVSPVRGVPTPDSLPVVTSPTVAMVSTDRTIVERLAPRKTASVQTLDDASLRAALASAGKPAGLIRVGGKTIWEGDWAVQRDQNAHDEDSRHSVEDVPAR